MENQLISKMSQKGQIVIPASIRKELGLKQGTELSFKVQGDEITIRKAPSSLEWSELLKDIPIENVDIDENGKYDPKKSPNFHDWMVNG